VKREIALLLIVTSLVCGFLTGQRFPIHHYAAFSVNGLPVLVDSTTGHICVSFAQTEMEKLAEKNVGDLMWVNNLFPPCSN